LPSGAIARGVETVLKAKIARRVEDRHEQQEDDRQRQRELDQALAAPAVASLDVALLIGWP
jgi:hypothetical protein